MAKERKLRWGDTLDDDDALPLPSIKGPDENGVKIITEYYKNDKGDAFKRVQKVKITSVEKKVYKVRLQAAASTMQGSGMSLCLRARAFRNHMAQCFVRANVCDTRRAGRPPDPALSTAGGLLCAVPGVGFLSCILPLLRCGRHACRLI